MLMAALFLSAAGLTAGGTQTELQGTWIVVSYEEGGRTAKRWLGAKFIIDGDKLTRQQTDAQGITYEDSLRLHLDPTKKLKQIDVLPWKMNEAALGIYVLEGTTLKICWNPSPGHEFRPTEFASEKGTVLRLMVLKRDKPGGKGSELQGTWTVVSYEDGGGALEKMVGATVIFDGDKMTFKDKQGEQSGPFRLDPAKKPKQIDFLPSKEEEERKIDVGIYVLQGDTLTISLNSKSAGRPTQFDTQKDNFNHKLVVLKREKK
jgi:uncharacterized protein (TIGR03067 family)